jgi:hypothetical protein
MPTACEPCPGKTNANELIVGILTNEIVGEMKEAGFF